MSSFGSNEKKILFQAPLEVACNGKIKIIVDEDGVITIEAKQGFEGKSCQEAIDHLRITCLLGSHLKT